MARVTDGLSIWILMLIGCYEFYNKTTCSSTMILYMNKTVGESRIYYNKNENFIEVGVSMDPSIHDLLLIDNVNTNNKSIIKRIMDCDNSMIISLVSRTTSLMIETFQGRELIGVTSNLRHVSPCKNHHKPYQCFGQYNCMVCDTLKTSELS